MKILSSKKLTIAFLGGSKIQSSNSFYSTAQLLSKKLSLLGHHILTGGGYGIMEAGNKGAFSVSINQSKAFLCYGEKSNNYIAKKNIRYFKTFQKRKLFLLQKASIIIFFPGGLGSLNELTELLVLMQNKKLPLKTTILFNESFWQPLIYWLQTQIISHKLANAQDLKCLTFSNSIEKILSIVEKESKKLQVAYKEKL